MLHNHIRSHRDTPLQAMEYHLSVLGAIQHRLFSHFIQRIGSKGPLPHSLNKPREVIHFAGFRKKCGRRSKEGPTDSKNRRFLLVTITFERRTFYFSSHYASEISKGVSFHTGALLLLLRPPPKFWKNRSTAGMLKIDPITGVSFIEAAAIGKNCPKR